MEKEMKFDNVTEMWRQLEFDFGDGVITYKKDLH